MILVSPRRICCGSIIAVLLALAVSASAQTREAPPNAATAPAATAPAATPPAVPPAAVQTSADAVKSEKAPPATGGAQPQPADAGKVVLPPTNLPAVVPTPASQPATPIGTTDGTGNRMTAGLHELSPWSMFLAADIVVKGVMVGLMIASLVTWTIFIGKTVELGVARRRLKKALRQIGGATLVSEANTALRSDTGFLRGLLVAASQELALSAAWSTASGVKERAESRFADLVRAETVGMRRGMGLLATIGSTAPFVGLFGTVWGIMNSFIGISKSQTTNLAVVAPGIAEALLATAIGLVAAIPAVIIYNHFSRATRSYQLLISRASGAVGRLLSRELDHERAGLPAPGAE